MWCTSASWYKMVIALIAISFITHNIYTLNTDHNDVAKDSEAYHAGNWSSQFSWADRLYAPTYITKIDNMYLLVDCWHHRVIYSENLTAPVGQWHDMSADCPLTIPHSVATNGEIVVVESSDHGSHGKRHSLAVHRIERIAPGAIKRFVFHERISFCPGKTVLRPHRVAYDATRDAFFVYATHPPTFAKYRWISRRKTLECLYCKGLLFMEGAYARSFAIVGNYVAFTAGPRSSLTFATLDGVNGTPRFAQRIRLSWVGMKTGTMNDIFYLNKYWYISSTYPCSLLRLQSLKSGSVQQLHKKLRLCEQDLGVDHGETGRCNRLGTPYYMSFVDGRIMVPFLFHCSGVLSFDPVTDSATLMWGAGWKESPADVERRGIEW